MSADKKTNRDTWMRQNRNVIEGIAILMEKSEIGW